MFVKEHTIFEDDKLLVLNKPSGVVVNTSNTTTSGTIQTHLEPYLKIPQGESEFAKRCGIVHRLDKDTSGVLLVAKTEDSFLHIKHQFMKRLIHKEYLALLVGYLGSDLVEVNAPLTRNPRNRIKFAVSKSGKSAQTRFEVFNTVNLDSKVLSLCNVFPTTGRTHQIRVHSLALNVPVAGDTLYLSSKNISWCQKNEITRLMLHAVKLTVDLSYDNKDRESVSFESPIPSDFDKFLLNK